MSRIIDSVCYKYSDHNYIPDECSTVMRIHTDTVFGYSFYPSILHMIHLSAGCPVMSNKSIQ